MKLLIQVCLYTIWSWLNKLGYEYKDVCKDIFIERYKQLNLVKDCANFLKIMEDLKSYIV